MPDREKVINGLECCTRYEVGKQLNNCLDCPYVEPIGFNQFRCKSQEMKEDALALLKEQDTVEHAKEVLCNNGWEKLRYPDGTIGKWDDPDVLRCKDCSYYRTDDWCNEHRRVVKETDYCSFGAWEGR